MAIATGARTSESGISLTPEQLDVAIGFVARLIGCEDGIQALDAVEESWGELMQAVADNGDEGYIRLRQDQLYDRIDEFIITGRKDHENATSNR